MPVIIDGTLGVNAAAVTTTSWNPTNLVIPGNSTIGDASSDTLTINATTNIVNNLGIGTNNPSTRLHVIGTNATAGGTDTVARFLNGAGGTTTTYVRIGNLADNSSAIGSVVEGLGNTAMVFNNNLGSTSYERMRIDSSGNVGIGTSPGTRLDVVNASTDSVIRARSTNSGSAGNFIADSTGLGYPGYSLYQGGTNIWSVQLRTDSNLYFYRQSGSGNVYVPFGNVGIGQASAANALTINGIFDLSTNLNGSYPVNSNGLLIGQNLSSGNAEVNFIYGSPAYSGTNGGFRFSQKTGASTGVDILRATQWLTQFYADGTEAMRISQSRGVSIGTTADAGAQNLLVQGLITATTGLTINGNNGLKVYATNNPPIQLVANTNTVQGCSFVNNWAAGSNTGVLIGTSEGAGTALQVSGSIPMTGGLPVGGGTALMTVQVGGAVVLKGGSTSATGTGIVFPTAQNASSDANTLDDYEEGTFTPQITVEGASGGLNAGTIYYAYYNKIGRTVHLQFYANWANVNANGASANGAILITNLPFAITKNGGTNSDAFVGFGEVSFGSANFYQGVCTLRSFNGATSSSTGGYLYVSQNSTKVDVGSYARVGGGPVNNNSSMALAFNLTYTTST